MLAVTDSAWPAVDKDRDEFIAAQARNRVAGSRRSLHPLRNHPQHVVAGGVTVAVVDGLEAIQVYEAHCQFESPGAGTDPLIDLPLQHVQRHRPILQHRAIIIRRSTLRSWSLPQLAGKTIEIPIAFVPEPYELTDAERARPQLPVGGIERDAPRPLAARNVPVGALALADEPRTR